MFAAKAKEAESHLVKVNYFTFGPLEQSLGFKMSVLINVCMHIYIYIYVYTYIYMCIY